MADESTTKTETKTETQVVDTIPKKEYEELSGKFTRIETLNQDLIKESESYKKQVAELLEEKAKFESADKNSKLKNAKTPEEIQALLDEQVNGVTQQFSSKLEDANKTIAAQALKLKEYQLSDKLSEVMSGRVKKDCQIVIKQKALGELQIDPANPDNIIIVDSNGTKVLSEVNTGQPMKIDEWMDRNEKLFPSMFEPKGAHNGTMPNGEQRQTSANGYTREEYLKARGTIKDRSERVKLDKAFGF